MAAVYPAVQPVFDLLPTSVLPQAIDSPSSFALHGSGQLDFAGPAAVDAAFAPYDGSSDTRNTVTDDDRYGSSAIQCDGPNPNHTPSTVDPSSLTLPSTVNSFTARSTSPTTSWNAVLKDVAMNSSTCPPTSPRSHGSKRSVDFSVNILTAAGLRITMARSAMDRLSHHKIHGGTVSQTLESTTQRYRLDNPSNPVPNSAQQPEPTKRRSKKTATLFETLVGLEKKQRLMPSYSFSRHGAQLREWIGSMGGPLNIESSQLSRVLVHLESTYGTITESYVWGQADFSQGLAEINSFFSSIWNAQQSFAQTFSLVADEMKSILGYESRPLAQPFTIREGSVLKSVLSRPAEGPYGVNLNNRLELVCQVTSLVTLCLTILELSDQPVELQQHVDYLHTQVDSLQLGNLPAERVMWFLQSSDYSDFHSRRIWAAAKYVWILKYVTYNVQCLVKEWLIKFLTGHPLDRCFKLDAFYFSYAS